MKRKHSLWQALERVPGLAAVEAEWKALAGSEYNIAKYFLRPNGKQASAYSCSSDCGCAHKVIVHSSNDIVAVCRCESKRCDTIMLKKSDIVVYELNWNALGASVATALQVIPEDKPVNSLHMTRRIGTYSPYAGFRFPVYLTIQVEPDEFQQVVKSLVSKEDKPFILCAPTYEHCVPECEKLLQKRDASFFSLADVFTYKDDGALAIEKPVDKILAAFRATVLPSTKETDSMVFFPTPPDTVWSDVSIKFKDGHTVTIKVGEASGTYNYTQMGMADERNGNPTKQWKLLESFATARGKFSWEHSDATRKNQKRRETLAENLRDFFRIEGDPFRWTKDGKAWEARFTIYYED